MAGGIIYSVGPDNSLTRMTPGQPGNEDEIQTMIATHPEMVAGSDEPLLLVERECGVSDRSEGSGRWSLDHLFVTREGRPVLVEVKQASNTQIRREVIGQLLEYAANASVYWSRDDLHSCFVRTCNGNEEEASLRLSEFLNEPGNDESTAPVAFWQRVESNLRSGDMTLVVVADQIPRELSRIIEFLNEQMRSTVQAVELRWFVADNGAKTLVPRLIGATERAAAKTEAGPNRPPNEYWVELKRRYPQLVLGAPWKDRAQNFFNLRTGNPTIVVGCRFVGNDLKLHVYFDLEGAKIAYGAIKQHRAEIEDGFGSLLEWDDMQSYKASRIVVTRPHSSMSNRGDWLAQHEWLYSQASKLAGAVRPFLPEVETALEKGDGSAGA